VHWQTRIGQTFADSLRERGVLIRRLCFGVDEAAGAKLREGQALVQLSPFIQEPVAIAV
jgi:hypothetical protein